MSHYAMKRKNKIRFIVKPYLLYNMALVPSLYHDDIWEVVGRSKKRFIMGEAKKRLKMIFGRSKKRAQNGRSKKRAQNNFGRSKKKAQKGLSKKRTKFFGHDKKAKN